MRGILRYYIQVLDLFPKQTLRQTDMCKQESRKHKVHKASSRLSRFMVEFVSASAGTPLSHEWGGDESDEISASFSLESCTEGGEYFHRVV